MQQSNIDKLEKYRHKLNLWVNDQTCHLGGAEKNEILQVIREEFNPDYTADMWCGSCVVSMMVFAFQQMDSWIAQQPKPEEEKPVDTITVDFPPDNTEVNHNSEKKPSYNKFKKRR